MTETSIEQRLPAQPARLSKMLQAGEAWTLPVITTLCLLIVWEIAGRAGLWNPLFFSHPSVIWQGFLSLAQGPLLNDLRVSATEFFIGMAIAVGLGIPIGLALGSIRRLYMMFNPLINALYSTPILVLTPLLIIWFGLGMGSKIANVVILAIFPIIITMIDGVQTTDRVLIRAARSFGATGLSTYREVIFPSIIPFFISGLRLAIGKGMIAVVVGEYIASTEGIGFRIRSDAEIFNTPRYLAAVLLMVVISVLIMGALRLLTRIIAPWFVLRAEH